MKSVREIRRWHLASSNRYQDNKAFTCRSNTKSFLKIIVATNRREHEYEPGSSVPAKLVYFLKPSQALLDDNLIGWERRGFLWQISRKLLDTRHQFPEQPVTNHGAASQPCASICEEQIASHCVI